MDHGGMDRALHLAAQNVVRSASIEQVPAVNRKLRRSDDQLRRVDIRHLGITAMARPGGKANSVSVVAMHDPSSPRPSVSSAW